VNKHWLRCAVCFGFLVVWFSKWGPDALIRKMGNQEKRKLYDLA